MAVYAGVRRFIARCQEYLVGTALGSQTRYGVPGWSLAVRARSHGRKSGDRGRGR